MGWLTQTLMPIKYSKSAKSKVETTHSQINQSLVSDHIITPRIIWSSLRWDGCLRLFLSFLLFKLINRGLKFVCPSNSSHGVEINPKNKCWLSRGARRRLSWGARRRLATAKAHIVPPDEVLCVGKGFLIMKLWLRFRSRHLVLWSLGTYGLRESG